METHEGNSVPMVKGYDFQVESSWAPETPIKPTIPQIRPIYGEDQLHLQESYRQQREEFLSQFSQTPSHTHTQRQTLLSCSVTSAEKSYLNDSNKLWETAHGTLYGGGMSLEQESVEMQRRGLEDGLPQWSRHGRRTITSHLGTTSSAQYGYPGYSSWDFPLPGKNNGENNYSDLSYNHNHMSFQALLAMKDSAINPSIAAMTMNNAATGTYLSDLATQSVGRSFDGSYTFRNEDILISQNQQFDSVGRTDMSNGALTDQQWSSNNANSPPRHANGRSYTLAPPTPDLRTALGKTNHEMNQKSNKHNGFQEQQVAEAIVNLQNLGNKEDKAPVTGSSPGEVSTTLENHNPDKGGIEEIDLNKTPQKKPRRRRYTPKVIREGKPKRTPKPKTPKATEPNDTLKVKRKYVRKNKTNNPSTSPAAEATEAIDPRPSEPAARSCRKSLNFDLNEQDPENNSLHISSGGLCREPQPEGCQTAGIQSNYTGHLDLGEELMTKTSQCGIAYDLNEANNQDLKSYMSLPLEDRYDRSHPDCTLTNGQNSPRSLQGKQELSKKDADLVQIPNCSPCLSSNKVVKTRGRKRGKSNISDVIDVNVSNDITNNSRLEQPEQTTLVNGSGHGFPDNVFSDICKKKRTDKGRSHASSTSSSATTSEDAGRLVGAQNYLGLHHTGSHYYYCHPGPFGNNAATNYQATMLTSAQNKTLLANTWVDIGRLQKKKRTKVTTRARDLTSLEGIASSSPGKSAIKHSRANKSNKPSNIGADCCMNPSEDPNFCETLNEDAHTTPKSKRRARQQMSSAICNVDRATKPHWDLVLYDGNQSSRKINGSIQALPWNSSTSFEDLTEAVIEGLKLLDINREGCTKSNKKRTKSNQEQKALVRYDVHNQEQNALVPYVNDGTMVPFVRKRRQRAKVDLDDETTRVWRLLLENINNEGIDGTDEEKAKWWDNERSVFHGRVDSFIARMRLVQGDRRFTPWKGSVLDSVIGVFLTQNVSDHLSSSAFMSLAARFPVKSECHGHTLSEEATSALVVEPEICIIEPEESITCNEKPADQPICDRTSRIINELDTSDDKEVVNSVDPMRSTCVLVSPTNHSCETSREALNDSRVEKENNQTIEIGEANSLVDDRARGDATSSQHSVISSQTSVNSPNLQSLGIRSAFPATNLQCNYSDYSSSFMGLLRMAEKPLLHEACGQTPAKDQLDCLNSITALDASLNYQSCLKQDLQHRASIYKEILESESRSPDLSRKDDNSITESILTTESTAGRLEKEKSLDGTPRSSADNSSSCYVLEGEEMVIQSQTQAMHQFLDNFPYISESTVKTNYDRNLQQVSDRRNSSGGISEVPNPNPSKPKKSGKDKRYAFDWDSLRKQAQANGIREKTANTRDSIDWEAVMHAKVGDIAETIKERGMNNMLAERIKALLDRLVEDHGSIDMEWLRDIPPDKAKEYLLSFRGLGLKSVECVRLLTLHHLAFPVDTNVGRIAVRLGWVPLQPLPESLQLHLLEMYPILESIQQYLWPRLCKLDQKTLYELHYHMITFGKVFCTKRQPNCNACPLRGECRHFASAFASARLALPGPEEKSIMASNGGSSIHLDPQASINPLPLPPAWSNHHLGTYSRCNSEALALANSCASLSQCSPHTIHHLERKPHSNCEPIVEVPASPEPEPEQEQTLCDIEDAFYDDPNEIPTIDINLKELSQTIQNYMQAKGEIQEAQMSKDLVALTPEAASIPTPKLKNINRLRTEHHVYELPDTHPLLERLDKRETDDPCSYLLAIWTPGETANSIEAPARRCSSEDPNMLCDEETCAYCSSLREANTQTVRGTLLIPCRTAMRGSFPLNGTYFQVNEVFADHDSSLNPIQVPRCWLWNLPRRTVFFGTSVPTIFKGLTTEEIQYCFWRGYVCVRGFDQKTRAPRPLLARLHFPASRMTKGAKGKVNDE